VIRKTVKHGSEGGGWKSAQAGNSLAAHPTVTCSSDGVFILHLVQWASPIRLNGGLN
jgi:hypothetical protein